MQLYTFPDFHSAVIGGSELLKCGKVTKLHLYVVSSFSTDCCSYVLSSCNLSDKSFYPHTLVSLGEMHAERGGK